MKGTATSLPNPLDALSMVAFTSEGGILIGNGELFVIHELRHQGLSISAIARHTGLDRKTVRKYLKQGLQAPRYGPRAPRPQLLDPYRGYLRERVEAYPGCAPRACSGRFASWATRV